MQLKHEGEKQDGNKVVFNNFRRCKGKKNNEENISKDPDEFSSELIDLLADNKTKRKRITLIEEKVRVISATCRKVTGGSVEALKRADGGSDRVC